MEPKVMCWKYFVANSRFAIFVNFKFIWYFCFWAFRCDFHFMVEFSRICWCWNLLILLCCVYGLLTFVESIMKFTYLSNPYKILVGKIGAIIDTCLDRISFKTISMLSYIAFWCSSVAPIGSTTTQFSIKL